MSKNKPKIAMRQFSDRDVAELEARAEAIASKAPGPHKVVADNDDATSKLRRDNFQGERLSAYIPPELSTKLRVKCAQERRSLSDAVTAALEAWL